MKYLLSLSILLFVCVGCSQKKLRIVFENSSQLRNQVSVSILINNQFFSKIPVIKTIADHNFKEITLNFPKGKDSISLEFTVDSTNKESKTVVYRDSIDNEAVIHVNFSQIMFLKGDSFRGMLLKNDSLVKNEFYSEVIYK